MSSHPKKATESFSLYREDAAMVARAHGFFKFFHWMQRPLLMLGLLLSIPAFYLLLAWDSEQQRWLGHVLYGVAALILLFDAIRQWLKHRAQKRLHGKLYLDALIIIGCLVSVFPTANNWGVWEWLFRLGLCAVILLRLSTLVLQQVRPSHLLQMTVLALVMLSTAGAGFYWLEPSVRSYADGVWLAFTTIATVGYGDIVPSTPAAKIFAVFIVLLGYAMFSIVTANIAALFVEEEEVRFERELHRDIRALREELHSMREILKTQEALLAAYAERFQASDAEVQKEPEV